MSRALRHVLLTIAGRQRLLVDTRLLKIFRAVAIHGGMAQASREIHLTVSALSHSLKQLETELGVRLFDRVGKRLLLNQAGEQLLSQIEGPLMALDTAENSIRALGRWGQGRLRVGASVTACQHLLPRVLRELRKDSPRLLFQVESGDIRQLAEWLRENRIDVAVGLELEATPDVESRPLFEDELLFVLSEQHPWADGRAISRADISREPLIVYHRASRTSRMVDQYFREQQIAPSSIMEIGSITAIKEMVKLNLGVAVLAPWVIDYELTKGMLKMRPLGPRMLRRSWAMIHLAQRRLNLVEERFYAQCRRQAAAMRLDRKDLPEIGKARKA